MADAREEMTAIPMRDARTQRKTTNVRAMMGMKEMEEHAVAGEIKLIYHMIDTRKEIYKQWMMMGGVIGQ